MKLVKRTLCLALILVMMVSILVVPASAATIASDWQSRFRSFKTVSEYYAPTRTEYVKALQRFLFAYDNTRSAMGQTTVDGSWGSKTTAAVGILQSALGYTPDYIVGPNTWEGIANKLSTYHTTYLGNQVCILKRTDTSGFTWYVYHLDIDTDTYYYRYYASHLADNSFSENNVVFHTDP